jgi:hypothetical protein
MGNGQNLATSDSLKDAPIETHTKRQRLVLSVNLIPYTIKAIDSVQRWSMLHYTAYTTFTLYIFFFLAKIHVIHMSIIYLYVLTTSNLGVIVLAEYYYDLDLVLVLVLFIFRKVPSSTSWKLYFILFYL